MEAQSSVPVLLTTARLEWAHGKVNWDDAPFEMHVKKVDVTDYSSGKEYSYEDRTGAWKSIKAKNGKIAVSGKKGQGKDKSNLKLPKEDS